MTESTVVRPGRAFIHNSYEIRYAISHLPSVQQQQLGGSTAVPTFRMIMMGRRIRERDSPCQGVISCLASQGPGWEEEEEEEEEVINVHCCAQSALQLFLYMISINAA